MILFPGSSSDRRSTAPGSPRAFPWLRANQQAFGRLALLATLGSAGCFPERGDAPPLPPDDTSHSAPWVLVPDPPKRAQMCQSTTLQAEIEAANQEIDLSKVLPERYPIIDGLTASEVETSMDYRKRETGEFPVQIDAEGREKLQITASEGAYADMLSFYPGVALTAEELYPLERVPEALWVDNPIEAVSVETAASFRVAANREIQAFQGLRDCLGIEFAQSDFAAAAAALTPLETDWNHAFWLDPNLPSLPDHLSGSELIDGQELLVDPLSPGQSSYVKFDSREGDDLILFLRQVVDGQYFDYLGEIAAFVRLASDEDGWRVPAEVLNANERFGFELRALVLSDSPGSDLKDESLATLRTQPFYNQMRQRGQNEYHDEHEYPRFTEQNRGQLLAELTANGSMVAANPRPGDHYILERIYESHLEMDHMANYTYTGTRTVVAGMGEHVNTGLHGYGLPEHVEPFLIVTAVGRTTAYQEALKQGVDLSANPRRRAGNRQALRSEIIDGEYISNSSHVRYNAMDISFRIEFRDTRTGATYKLSPGENPELTTAAVGLMLEYLVQEGEADRTMGVLERGNCVHVVGKTPAAEERAQVEGDATPSETTQ